MASRNYRDKVNQKVLGGPTAFTNANSSSLNQWFGDTLITSRHEYVAAPLVAATSRVRLDAHFLSHVNSTPTVAMAFLSSSVQPGSGFYISATNSVAFAGTVPYSVAVWWEIVQR
jgi:hypothetical protein